MLNSNYASLAQIIWGHLKEMAHDPTWRSAKCTLGDKLLAATKVSANCNTAGATSVSIICSSTFSSRKNTKPHITS
jgi:hypothetical protein